MSRGRGPGGTEPLPFVVASRDPGRVEQAVTGTIDQARADDLLEDLDAGIAQLAIAAAQAVDLALGARDPYAFSQPARELRETLARLKLDPIARGTGPGRDPFDAFLEDLGDDGTTGPVRDSADGRPA